MQQSSGSVAMSHMTSLRATANTNLSIDLLVVDRSSVLDSNIVMIQTNIVFVTDDGMCVGPPQWWDLDKDCNNVTSFFFKTNFIINE